MHFCIYKCIYMCIYIYMHISELSSQRLKTVGKDYSCREV